METTDIIAIVPLLLIVAVLGIAIGMYITTQISDWIETRTQNEDLMDNMDKMDKKL